MNSTVIPLACRPELLLNPIPGGEPGRYALKDLRTGDCYTLGGHEYFLLGRLDGGRIMLSLAETQFMHPNELRVAVHAAHGSVELRIPEHTYGVWRQGDPGWQWSGPTVGERDDLFRRQARRLPFPIKSDPAFRRSPDT